MKKKWNFYIYEEVKKKIILATFCRFVTFFEHIYLKDKYNLFECK